MCVAWPKTIQYNLSRFSRLLYCDPQTRGIIRQPHGNCWQPHLNG